MGHSFKNNKGFTLVEVMVAAGIMGVLAVFFYKFFADQIKTTKSVMQRVDEQNLLNEMRLLLMNERNCYETFKNRQLTRTDTFEENEGEVNPVKSLKKVFITLPEGASKPRIAVVEKYLVYDKKDPSTRYGHSNLKIHRYQLEVTDEDVKLLQKFSTAELFLRVEFDRGDHSLGNKIMNYKMPIHVTVNPANRKLTTCSSTGVSNRGMASTIAIDAVATPDYKGKTGTEACNDKQLACAYVVSTNYVESSSGLEAALYTPACLSSYNKNLQGVANGVGRTNIHSCSAKLGKHTTFELNIGAAQIICSANFSAICN